MKFGHRKRVLDYIMISFIFKDKLAKRNGWGLEQLLYKVCVMCWRGHASDLVLSYLVAEYCSLVWINSAHSRLVNIHLNGTMRTISGTI